MGTSVGTITLLSPITVAVSQASGFNLLLCVGSVMGGAMFGDNLSFIYDTTIAACNGQVEKNFNLIQIIPYISVLIGGIIGFNILLFLFTSSRKRSSTKIIYGKFG